MIKLRIKDNKMIRKEVQEVEEEVAVAEEAVATRETGAIEIEEMSKNVVGTKDEEEEKVAKEDTEIINKMKAKILNMVEIAEEKVDSVAVEAETVAVEIVEAEAKEVKEAVEAVVEAVQASSTRLKMPMMT